jgi:Na+/H+ antiporter NhaD/arsenite permease-like protein
MTVPFYIQVTATVLFAIAILHTFSVPVFARLAHKNGPHAGFWHFLSEVEAVFGIWAFVLLIVMSFATSVPDMVAYVEGRNFTEPLFVFAIMIVAGTKPILYFATNILHSLSKIVQLLLRIRSAPALYFLTLAITPLLGSFITEPAAMTLAAFLLRDLVYRHKCSTVLLFGTLGVLFVNISIGGTLTNFAAPPVLMVASTWGWSSAFMFANFGLESCIAIFINALVVTLLFHRQLIEPDTDKKEVKIPLAVILVHLLFLFGVVVFAHDPRRQSMPADRRPKGWRFSWG